MCGLAGIVLFSPEAGAPPEMDRLVFMHLDRPLMQTISSRPMKIL